MAFIDPVFGAKLTYILGIANIIGILLVLFSCRCILGWRPQFLQRQKWFMAFYRYHCWYWRVFLLSVLLHAVLAITSFGNPL